MGSTLTSLASQSMQRGANLNVGSYINDWVNWAIQEVWNDRMWRFRIRNTVPAGLTLPSGSRDITLPTDFHFPKELRVTAPSSARRDLKRITIEDLAAAVIDPDDSNDVGPPLHWVDEILEVLTITADEGARILKVWPTSDQIYTIKGTYYAMHPVLTGGDFCLIPKRYDSVITARTVVYIKESEDESSVASPLRAYGRELIVMRNMENRRTNALPSFKPEQYLQQIRKYRVSLGRDVDLG